MKQQKIASIGVSNKREEKVQNFKSGFNRISDENKI